MNSYHNRGIYFSVKTYLSERCCSCIYLDRMLKFLGVLTIEAFAASALGMTVGALAKDEDAALALGPALMTVFILFSGQFMI